MSTKKITLYKTGFTLLDNQHQHILDTINLLIEQLASTSDKDQLLQLCTTLVDALRSHYDEEERFLLKHFYPDTEGHIGQHMYYLHLLGKLIGLIKDDDLLRAQNTVKYMRTWYLDHIKEADKKYADYIHNQSA